MAFPVLGWILIKKFCIQTLDNEYIPTYFCKLNRNRELFHMPFLYQILPHVFQERYIKVNIAIVAHICIRIDVDTKSRNALKRFLLFKAIFSECRTFQQPLWSSAANNAGYCERPETVVCETAANLVWVLPRLPILQQLFLFHQHP